ncbi:MAG TPA: 4-hydroxy-tetrahydrodipicolinate synthase [Bacteroidota bacterium]|nr:4-hydroxy-tetrahydrodipicolinate synthase [Bacteroidota bacterium]
MSSQFSFRGVATALVTPMLASDGTVDERSLRALVDFQITNGVNGLVPCGTTGESATLNHAEHHHVMDVVVEQAAGRVPVIVGAGSNSTHEAISLTQHARAIGANAVLSIAPYYNKPTQSGFFEHYKAISESVDIPIIVYNVPGRTGSNINAETTLKIAELPGIAGIKEASGNMQQVMEILRHRPSHFTVLSGDDALALPLLALGADGVISVVSNETPRLFSTMVRLCLEGNFAEARGIHEELLQLMNLNFIESNPIPVKGALAIMGIIEEAYRLPLTPMTTDHRFAIRRALEELHLMETQK